MATPRVVNDLYGELGVSRDASRDQIAAAFRARAKALHPDAQPGRGLGAGGAAETTETAERFKRVAAAYRLLSDPVARARYDADAAAAAALDAVRSPPRQAPATPPAGPARRPFRLTRRSARWAAGGGAALIVLGFVVGAFVFSLQRHDADLRAHGVATTAIVVEAGGERRLEFTTASGRQVRAVESVKSGEEQPPVGSTIAIHYDRADPTNVVTDESHTARNITLWIVAVKLVVGGAVLVWFGRRRLRDRSELPA